MAYIVVRSFRMAVALSRCVIALLGRVVEVPPMVVFRVVWLFSGCVPRYAVCRCTSCLYMVFVETVMVCA